MPYERRLSVEGGKYTFFIPEGDYKIHVLRYDQPWLILEQGSNAIWSLIAELIDARELITSIETWRALPKAGFHDGELEEAHDKFRRERGQEPFKDS